MPPRGAKARIAIVLGRLQEAYPGRAPELCALRFTTPFQLLVATILSAQTTDESVNAATPELFSRYPDSASLAAADPGEVEELVRTTGFFRNKARSIIAMAAAVESDHGGLVPSQMDDLVQLAGVGRKTANVLLSVAFDLPGLPVDTHVTRLSKRLGLSNAADPIKIEADLNAMVAPAEWGTLSLRMILHGRAVCVARKPRCGECLLADICPSAAVGLSTTAPTA